MTVKAVESAFLFSVISSNNDKPRVLNIFYSVINPCATVPKDASSALCANFLKFFGEKISALRSPHSQAVLDLDSSSKCCFSAV